MFGRRSPLEKEMEKALVREQKFLAKRAEKKDTKLNQLLAEKVPENLQNTLDKAFAKSFGVVFEKGTGIIEKTYNKNKAQQEFLIDDYTAQVKGSRKKLKVFSKKAKGSGRGNMLLSGISGVGLGVLGIGIPDIVLFTALMLKNIYQIALNYGYDYKSDDEKQFILLIIQGAVSYGDELTDINNQLNFFIENGYFVNDTDIPKNIDGAAGCLSEELLYMKFLQGIPVVGAVGGGYDLIYMKQINNYAQIKYRQRFFADRTKTVFKI